MNADNYTTWLFLCTIIVGPYSYKYYKVVWDNVVIFLLLSLQKEMHTTQHNSCMKVDPYLMKT